MWTNLLEEDLYHELKALIEVDEEGQSNHTLEAHTPHKVSQTVTIIKIR